MRYRLTNVATSQCRHSNCQMLRLALGMCSPFSTLHVRVQGLSKTLLEDLALSGPVDLGVKARDLPDTDASLPSPDAGRPGDVLVALLVSVVLGVDVDPSPPCAWNETMIVAGDPSWPITGLPSRRRTYADNEDHVIL